MMRVLNKDNWRKKGELIIEMTIKLLILAIIIGAVVYIFIQFITPDDDRTEATSKYHYDYLLSEMDRAREGKSARFPIIHSAKINEDASFYIVYFDDNARVSYKKGALGKEFFILRGKQRENALCVCSVEGKENSCSFCKDIGRDAYLNYNTTDIPWVLEIGDPFIINFTGGVYVFDDGKKS